MAKQLKEITDKEEGIVQVKDTRIKQLEESVKLLERRLADDTGRLVKQLEASLAQGSESGLQI